MEIRVRYALNGNVNGAIVNLKGVGEIRPATGAIHLDLDSQQALVPPSWDPAFILFSCLDGLYLLSTMANTKGSNDPFRTVFGPDEVPVHFDTRLTLFDDEEREVGTTVVSSILQPDDDKQGGRSVGFRTQLVEARLRIAPMERVAQLGILMRSVLASANSPWIVATSALRFDTTLGNSYKTVATSSFEIGCEKHIAPGPLSFECHRTSGPEDELSVQVTPHEPPSE